MGRNDRKKGFVYFAQFLLENAISPLIKASAKYFQTCHSGAAGW